MFLSHSMHCKRDPSSVMASPSICPILHNVLLKTVLLKTVECTVYYDMIYNMIHIQDYCQITKDMKEKLRIIIVSFYCVSIHFWLAAHRKDTDTCSTYIHTCICICELFTYVIVHCILHILYYNNVVCIYVLKPKHISYKYYSVYHWPSQPVNAISTKKCVKTSMLRVNLCMLAVVAVCVSGKGSSEVKATSAGTSPPAW